MASYSGTAPTIPDWLMLNSGKPSAEELARLKAPRASTAARNTAIPVLYGRERIDGRMFYAQVDKTNGFLYVGYLLCEGEIDSIEAVLMDGVDVTTGLLVRTGAAINRYTGGAGNVADPLLKEANIAVGLPAYTDTLPGTCYVVLKVPRGASSGFPRVEAIVKGRKVYDPRKDSTNGGSGTQRLANKATWTYSDNPTLCFADFCTQLAGWSVVWPSIIENANYNDTLIGGVKKRTVGLLLQAQASASEWAQGFRVYMGAYLARENGAIRVVADRADVIPGTTQYNAAIAGTDLAALNAVGVAYHFRPDDIKAGTLSLKNRSQRNSPNSIIVEYTEARLVEGWRTETVQVDAPTLATGAPRRNSKVSMVGIKDRSQAYREAVERLNWFQSDLEGSFTAWDEGLMVQVGSIIAITHPSPIPMAAKLFRVVGHSFTNGRWSYNIAEYFADMYSDAVVPPDGYVPPVQVDPTVIPDIVGLVAAEELFTYKDGTIRSRVRIAWSPDDSPYLQGYQVEAWVGTRMLFQTFTKVNTAYTDAIEELNGGVQTNVTVKVAAVYRSGMGKYTSAVVPVRGKQTPPPAITSAVASAGNEQVTLDWIFPSQEKMTGTEVWVSTVNNLGNAVRKGVVPYPQNNATLTNLTADVPVYIWLRMVDQVGNTGAYYPTSATAGLTATPTKSASGQQLADEIAQRMAEDARVASEAATALAGESQQRITAVQQVTDSITTLTTTVNQNAAAAASALLAQKNALEAQITSLSTTLTQADLALAQRIDTLSASIGEQFDSFKQWTFDTTTESWGSNGGSPTWVDGWLRPFNNSASYVQSPAPLAMSGNTYRSIKLRMRKVGNPVWSGRVRWTTDADLTWDDTKSVVIPEPKFDANGIAVVTINDLAWSGASPIRQIRIALTTNQSATTYVLYDWIAFGNPSPGASTAALQSEATARADGDSAQATARETLAAQMRGGYTGTDINAVTSGLIFSEKQARTSAVEAVASSVTSLQAVLGNIGGDNLLTDSSFETSNNGASLLPNWQTSSTGATTVSYGDSPLPGSGRFLSVSGTLVGSGQYVGVEPATSLRPKAVAGQKYVNSVWAKGTPGATLRMVIQFLTAGSASGLNTVTQDFTLTDAFQRYVMNPVVAAANSALVRGIYRVIGGATSATLQLDIDNAQLQQGEVATQWMPSGEEMIKKNIATATAVTGLEVRVTTAEGGITSLTNQYTSLQSTLNNIGGDNLLPNSSFEDRTSDSAVPTGWAWGGNAAGATRTYVDSDLPGSTKAVRMSSAAPTSAGHYIELRTPDQLVKASPGQKYLASAFVRCPVGTCSAALILWFLDSSGATIGSASQDLFLPGTDWRRVVSTVRTAPANTAYVRTYCRLLVTVASQPVQLDWDNVQLQQGEYATQWMPSGAETATATSANSTAITGLTTRVTAAEGLISSTSNSVTSLTSKVSGLRLVGDNIVPNSDFTSGMEWWSQVPQVSGNTIVWGAASGNGGPGVVITRGAGAASSPYIQSNDGKFYPLRLGAANARRQFRAYVWAKADTAGATLLCRLSVRTNGTSEGQADTTVNLTTAWARYTVEWASILETRTEFLPRFFATAPGTSVSISSIEVYDVTEQVAVDGQATAITGLTTSVTQLGNTITALGTSVTQVQANIGSLTAYRILANAGLTANPSGAPLSSGIRNAAGTLLYNGNRGFNVVPINADGTLGTRVAFDTYGNLAQQAQALIDYITALPENQYFLMYTSDSIGSVQGTGTVLTALRQTMLDAGASTTTWSLVSGSRMYIFVGRRRLGAGAGVEVISPTTPAGSTSTRQDLWCDYNLTVVAGAPVGMDGNRAAIASTEANAQGLTDLTARVTSAEGAITATSSQVTSLSAAIQSVGGDNLLPNSSFEDSTSATAAPTSWSTEGTMPSGVSLSYVDSPLSGGGRAFRFVATATAANQYIGLASSNVFAEKIKGQPNTDYTLSSYLRGSAGCTLRLYIQFVNASNTVVATVTSTDVTATGEWQRVQVTGRTTNTTAVAMRVFVGRLFSPVAQGVALELDNVMLQQGSVATGYMPSALDLSGKINAAASAVTAMQATVTSLNGTVTALSSQVTSLSASIDGKANASVVVSMQAQVNNQGAGGNLIPNSTFPNWSGTGWSVPSFWRDWGNHTGPGWIPFGLTSALHSGRSGAVAANDNQYSVMTPTLAAIAGKTYCIAVGANTHRCNMLFYAEFKDNAGNIIGSVACPEVPPQGRSAGPLNEWQRYFAIQVAPPGTATVQVVIRLRGTGESDPWVWLWQPMLCEVAAGATQPPPYSPGGGEANAQWAVSVDANGRVAGLRLASNGSTTTFDVLADQFRIISPSGGQRLEYSGGNIRTYDGNGVLRVQMGTW